MSHVCIPHGVMCSDTCRSCMYRLFWHGPWLQTTDNTVTNVPLLRQLASCCSGNITSPKPVWRATLRRGSYPPGGTDPRTPGNVTFYADNIQDGQYFSASSQQKCDGVKANFRQDGESTSTHPSGKIKHSKSFQSPPSNLGSQFDFGNEWRQLSGDQTVNRVKSRPCDNKPVVPPKPKKAIISEKINKRYGKIGRPKKDDEGNKPRRKGNSLPTMSLSPSLAHEDKSHKSVSVDNFQPRPRCSQDSLFQRFIKETTKDLGFRQNKNQAEIENKPGPITPHTVNTHTQFFPSLTQTPSQPSNDGECALKIPKWHLDSA